MNADSCNSRSESCPICGRSDGIQVSRVVGLLSCQHCRERLVVSWSGHYVRDPFTLRQLFAEQMLRRQSRPLARIFRDFGIAKYSLLVAALGGVVCIGLVLPNLEGSRFEPAVSEPWQWILDKPESTSEPDSLD